MNTKKAKQLGAFIKQHREAKGLSIRALAAKIGVNPSAVLHLERGEYAKPDPQKLMKISRALDVAIEDLYAFADYDLFPSGLPEFAPYLRSKYDLTENDITELDEYFTMLKDRNKTSKKRGRK